VEWVWSAAYTASRVIPAIPLDPIRRSAASRAATSVTSIASLVVPRMTPPPVPRLAAPVRFMKLGGRRRSCASQSSARTSISVAAGDACHVNPTLFIAEAMSSPAMPAALLVDGKNAKKFGLAQCVIPGTTASRSSFMVTLKGAEQVGGADWSRRRR
jgi:hypothetical protein